MSPSAADPSAPRDLAAPDAARQQRRRLRVLTTLLFTDIARSTEHAARLGDERWLDVLNAHDDILAEEIARHGGNLIKLLGDGALATFGAPSLALGAAEAITSRASAELGLGVRAGVHSGECDLVTGDVRGLAVHVGARVAALAEPGEVLVTGTVADLLIGAGHELADRGSRELHGVPGRWPILALQALAAPGLPGGAQVC